MGKFLALVIWAGVLGVPAAASALDLQGHRGARAEMPENTLPGFAYALSVGVTTLELDLGITGDGVVIVNHDPVPSPAVVRDDTGSWVVADASAFFHLPLAVVKTYDVGSIDPQSRYASRFPSQKQLNGITIPTLAEVFDLVKRSGNQTVRFNLETKLHPGKPGLTPPPAEFVAVVLAEVKAHGLADRVTIQSFDWRTLAEVQRLAPGITTSYLTAQQKWLDNIELGQPGASPWTAGFDADEFSTVAELIVAAGGDVWSPFFRDVTGEAIAHAQGLGLKVKVWTVNDAAIMAEMIDMGVDGIITDDPAMLRRVMTERSLPLPVATPVTPGK